jgi:hypothetical protein
MSVNIFFDMDGVLAQYDPDILLHMDKANWFKNLPAVESMIDFAKWVTKNTLCNVYILSTVTLNNAERCQAEKTAWNAKYTEIPVARQIYVPNGIPKIAHLKAVMPEVFDRDTNILYDDYTKNLIPWVAYHNNFIAIKVLNGLNGTNGVWLQSKMPSVHIDSSLDDKIINLRTTVKAVQLQ